MALILNPNIVEDGLEFNVDISNPKSWSPNVVSQPTNLYAVYNTLGATVSAGSYSQDKTRTPVGYSPIKLVSNSTDTYIASYNESKYNICPAVAGQKWIASFYAKANVQTTSLCYLFGSTSTGNYVEASSDTHTITTSWQRYSFSINLANASTRFLQFRFGCNVNGVTIWFDGLQIEKDSAATKFNPIGNPNGYWRDLSGNSIDLTPKGTINPVELGGVKCFGFGFNNSMYWESTLVAAQKTDYRYGATIELWLYNETKTARKTIFQKLPTYGSYASYQQEIAMTWETNNTISCYRNYNDYDAGSSAALNNNAWNHCVLVLYPHLSSGQWYLNGAAVGSYTKRAKQLPPQAGAIQIGTGYSGTCDTGGIAIARTYRRMFDGEDALQNFNALRSRFGL